MNAWYHEAKKLTLSTYGLRNSSWQQRVMPVPYSLPSRAWSSVMASALLLLRGIISWLYYSWVCFLKMLLKWLLLSWFTTLYFCCSSEYIAWSRVAYLFLCTYPILIRDQPSPFCAYRFCFCLLIEQFIYGINGLSTITNWPLMCALITNLSCGAGPNSIILWNSQAERVRVKTKPNSQDLIGPRLIRNLYANFSVLIALYVLLIEDWR